ncbi:unnamed protein product [Meganyctiphanes norvegica]|uniref:Uncharacterized protein n=1 Tax=Meganyctiphanes norvegica TaxID=48144 RepID=A0AAV2Q800_MEGNR
MHMAELKGPLFNWIFFTTFLMLLHTSTTQDYIERRKKELQCADAFYDEQHYETDEPSGCILFNTTSPSYVSAEQKITIQLNTKTKKEGTINCRGQANITALQANTNNLTYAFDFERIGLILRFNGEILEFKINKKTDLHPDFSEAIVQVFTPNAYNILLTKCTLHGIGTYIVIGVVLFGFFILALLTVVMLALMKKNGRLPIWAASL